jgi:protein-L-isoaspartate(D-aspartate) O-methyltransferase
MPDFVLARRKMVENQLMTNAVTDRRLLGVMGQVPRELFVPEDRRELAYIDDAHRLNAATPPRCLAAPATFARLVQLAGVTGADRVLDLGCGTGYSAAVLAGLAAAVIGVESDPALAAAARTNLAALGIRHAEILVGPLAEGAKARGPYDVILLEGQVDRVPETLFAQLAQGGRLVAVVRQGATGVAELHVKSGRDVAGRAEFNAVLPPLEAPPAEPVFVF